MTTRSFARCLTLPKCASARLTAALSVTYVAASVGGSSKADSGYAHGPGITNHPIHVVPSESVIVPSSWPLDGSGGITCLTCHTDILDERKESGPRLRDFEWQTAEPTEFCTKCHGQTGQRNARSMHWLALGVAHISSDPADARAGGRVLDTHTRQCLSCHDGVIATESKNVTPWTHSRGYSSDGHRNHPIGVRYDRLSRPKDLSPLRPASMLPQEVTLPDWKVGCVSCHNLYAQERHLLTVPIEGSELCLTCHDMR